MTVNVSVYLFFISRVHYVFHLYGYDLVQNEPDRHSLVASIFYSCVISNHNSFGCICWKLNIYINPSALRNFRICMLLLCIMINFIILACVITGDLVCFSASIYNGSLYEYIVFLRI